MNKLKIIQLSDYNIYSQKTSLRQPSATVVNFDDEFQNEVDSLLETFYNWKIAVALMLVMWANNLIIKKN